MTSAVGGIVSGIGSVVSGLIGSNAASKASSQLSSAIQSGLNYAENAYNTASTNLSPWIGGGQSALSSLLNFYGLGGSGASQAAYKQFTGTPSYQFPLQQGLLSAQRALQASGGGTGATLKDLTNYASGYASTNLNNW